MEAPIAISGGGYVRVRLRRLTPLAVVLFCSTGLLHAQTEGLRDRDRSLDASRRIAAELQAANIHAGPFFLLSRFDLSDIGFDQQYFAPTHDQTTGLSLSIVAPQRIYYVPTKKTIFSAALTPSYSLLGHRSERQRLTVIGRSDAQFLLNHIYIDIYGQSGDALRANTGELDRVFTARERQFGTTGEVKYSSKTSATFSLEDSRYRHPTDKLQPLDPKIDIRLFDRDDTSFRFAFVHKTFPLTSLLLATEGAKYTFRNAHEEDSTRTYVGPGVLYDNGLITARLEAGYGQLNFKSPSSKDYKGVLGNLSASHRVTFRWSYSLNAARDVDFSLLQHGNSYYVFDRINPLIEYAATRRLTLRALSQLGWDRYDVPAFTDDGLFLRRKDTIVYNAVGFLYAIRHGRGGFDIGYYTRKSNFHIDEQNGIRILLHLSYSP